MLLLDETQKISLIEQLLGALNITGGLATASSIILSIGVILILGFLMTRLTKLLKLPNVTAYIVVGILIGPNLINLIPEEFIERTDFISDIALVFIAFAAGEFFKINDIKKTIGKAIAITAIEAVITFGLIFALCLAMFGSDKIPFCLLLAALGSATAPTSTIMTIKQTGSKGHYVNTLLEVLAIDSVVSLVLYTISISIFVGTNDGHLSFGDVGWPLLKMLICLAIGVGFGFALRLLISSKRTTDNRLIIIVAVLLLFCGICALFGQSPLLGGLAIGAVYTNLSKKEEKIFAQVNYFIPPIMLLFFVRGGMSLDFNVFAHSQFFGTAIPFILIVIIFLVSRFAGKYSGCFVGGLATSQPKETRNFLGFGLIPQASVAIALATMAVRTIKALGDGAQFDDYANALLSIILATSILFELIGPALAKLGLYLSHSYGKDETIDKADIHEDKEIKANEEAYTEAAENFNEQ